jgi:phosphatidylglycerol---prolipoprotein diacylglyceryl transferase
MWIPPVAHWVHSIDPVIFQLGDHLAVRWYGLSYVLGFVCAWSLIALYRRMGRITWSAGQQEQLFIAGMIGVLAGGRFGHVLLYDWPRFVANPLSLFFVWEGGMASHGGFVGVALACIWFAYRNRLSPLAVGDIVATITAPGLLFGRLANFINGELWGKVSDVPWAVIFPASEPHGTPLEWIAARHPSQLYQAALEGLVLLLYIQHRFWRNRYLLDQPGRIAGEFWIGYALLRIVGEIFREPDAALILGLNPGIFYSFPLMAAGIAFIVCSRQAWSSKPLGNRGNG